MKNPIDCPTFRTCNAMLCPLDDEIEYRYWYPGESICSYQAANKGLDWIRRQRAISKKAKNNETCFTLKMLKRHCKICKGIVGINLENDRETEERQWLKKHPEIRKMSAKEKTKIAERMNLARHRKILAYSAQKEAKRGALNTPDGKKVSGYPKQKELWEITRTGK